MIHLDDSFRIEMASSSRGDQRKFYKDGYWVKLDNEGYFEGLAEEFVSYFCTCIEGFSSVEYRTSMFEYNERQFRGCVSKTMFGDKNICFTSIKSLAKSYNVPLRNFVCQNSVEQNIINTVVFIRDNFGVNILSYLGRLLMLDCIIINEDRHLMNLGICYNKKLGVYMEAPCFDNGTSLFCTYWSYRKRKSLEENIEFAKSVAKPFSKFYDKQLSALLNLGCKPLLINKVRLEYILDWYTNDLYPKEVLDRVKAVLLNRLRYYEGSAFIYV